MAQVGFAFAVHALVLLAKSPESVTSAYLAGSVNIHATCVRKVMAPLTRAGLVRACEGRDGGYRLARPAADISLADIYDALAREPLLSMNPAAANPYCPVSVAMGPALAEIAADAQAGFEEALARRSLADLTNRLEVVIPAPPPTSVPSSWGDTL